METKKEKKKQEGWWGPAQSRNYHYFVDGRALCSGWIFPSYPDMQPDTGNTEHKQGDCKACFKKLLKRRKDFGVDKMPEFLELKQKGEKENVG